MRHLFADIRFAVRLVWRGPAFFATLVAVLVLGIGATTAMFSVAESLLLKPLPYPAPEELTMLWREDPRVHEGPVSIPDFLDYKAGAASFASLVEVSNQGLSLSSPGAKPEALAGARVTGEFFTMLGLRPLAGRLLTPEDDKPGGPRVAVVGSALWRRRFASDPALIGRTITLNSEPYTVVGVAPEGFIFAGPNTNRCDVWTPFATSPGYKDESTQRGDHFANAMGRRKPGVSLEQAQAELTGIAKNLEALYPNSNAKKTVRLVDLHDALVGSARSSVWVLFAAVSLVFLVVCANVATLLLTRAQSRRAEMATRAALGATPSRLAGQVVTETVVVFLAASIGGALLARTLVAMLASGLIDRGGASTIDVGVDPVAVTFSVVACFACGVVFGLVPALAASRVEPQAVLKDSAARAGVSRSQKMVRGGLVVAQVALAFALLVGSGLALRAFAKLSATPPGFDPEGVLSSRIVLPEARYGDGAAAVRFYTDVIARIAERPGVSAVAANDTLPMAGSNSNGSFVIEGRPPPEPGDAPNLERNVVTSGYFAAMGIPMLRGREFTPADTAESRKVMVISHATAEQFFPGQDPIGQRIDWEDTDEPDGHVWREIVGVSGDVRRRGLDYPVSIESYVPMSQHPSRWMVVVARSTRPTALRSELPGIVQAVDPDQAIADTRTMTDRVSGSVTPQRYVALLLGAFSAAALILAVLGIFGLVSYATAQRTRELGIRMALGSTPGAAVLLVIKEGLRLVVAGLGVGLVAGAFVGRILASRMVGVAAVDLPVYAAIPTILGATCLLACLIPAWRAARVPPALALRYE
jgi:putative ABC transport system permease protein